MAMLIQPNSLGEGSNIVNSCYDHGIYCLFFYYTPFPNFTANSASWFQILNILISWLMKKLAELDLYCNRNKVYLGSKIG